MKLRRALAAAAATAALAPVALLSAPAASATEATPAVTPGTSSTPTPPAPEATPPAEPTTPVPDKPTPPAEPTRPTAPAKRLKDVEPPEVPDGDAEQAPGTCPSDDGDEDPDSVLEVDLVGLPKKIVAGSGWHRFELNAANPSDEPLGEVDWTTFVNNLGADAEAKDGLRYFTDLQFFDPETEKWTKVKSSKGEGLAYGTVDLDAEDEAVVKLRAKVGAGAPAVEGYAVALGSYVDADLDCTHTSSEYLPLTVVKKDDGKATAEPKPSASKSAAAEPRPQGSTTPTPAPTTTPAPVTGSLAETGSSSMLPTVALIGGVAVLAGAGVVFAVRRRKADTTA